MDVTLSFTPSALPSQVAEYKRTWSRTTPGCLLAGATTRTVEEMDWIIIGWAVDAGWEPEALSVDVLTDHDEWSSLCTEALDYLETLLPEGHYFTWIETDLHVVTAEEDSDE